MRRAGAWMLTLAGVITAAGCSSPPEPPPPQQPVTLRIGYVAELADGPVLAGLQARYIGSGAGGVNVSPVAYPTAAQEAQALARGQLDAACLDPVLAVAVWQAAGNRGITIVAGSASGGAQLVTRSGVTSPGQLAGGKLAAPAGTAQQAALDWWLQQAGVRAAPPGQVTMTGAYLARAIGGGKLAAAWEPAPEDAQVTAAGGRVLLDEAALWPGGQFATAVLAVTTRFLAAHPAAVTVLLQGHLEAIAYLDASPASAHAAAARQLAAITGARLPAGVLAAGFAQVRYTPDPLAGTVFAEAQHAAAAGLVRPVPGLAAMRSLFTLGPLNQLLRAARQRPVTV